jgi:hypothetical protein
LSRKLPADFGGSNPFQCCEEFVAELADRAAVIVRAPFDCQFAVLNDHANADNQERYNREQEDQEEGRKGFPLDLRCHGGQIQFA